MDIPDRIIAQIRRAACYGVTTGRMQHPVEIDYVHRCSWFHWQSGTVIMFTHDTGHHSSGWMKNPDYERCRHLSLSFQVPWPGRAVDELGSWERFKMMSGRLNPVPFDPALARAWVRAIFADDARYAWMEGPFTREAKRIGVTHWRVFCDRAWKPIVPRNEVYSKDFTEKGWLSWSDQNAERPSHVDAD